MVVGGAVQSLGLSVVGHRKKSGGRYLAPANGNLHVLPSVHLSVCLSICIRIAQFLSRL